MNFILDKLSREFKVEYPIIKNILRLYDNGATIPFITRYRKEKTGSIREELIFKMISRLDKFMELQNRKKVIIRTIKKQKKLTPFLVQQIRFCNTKEDLDDFFFCYKSKNQITTSISTNKNLELLAIQIYVQKSLNLSLNDIASKFIKPSEGFNTVEEVLDGTSQIIVGWIIEDVECRKRLHDIVLNNCSIKIQLRNDFKDDSSLFEEFKDYSERINSFYLDKLHTIIRGERQKILRFSIVPHYSEIFNFMFDRFIKTKDRSYRDYLEKCVKKAFERHIYPDIERSIKRELKKKADSKIIDSITKNIKSLLLFPPLGKTRILAIKPTLDDHYPLVVIDEDSRLIANCFIDTNKTKNEIEKSITQIKEIIEKHDIKYIAISNVKESDKVKELLSQISVINKQIEQLYIDESFSIAYSLSDTSKTEFPDLDEWTKAAIYIARYCQNPMEEILKVDPITYYSSKYFNLIDKNELEKAVNWVIVSCVNFIGVDLNTSSHSVLKYISGLDDEIAKNIIDHRSKLENGFTSRNELKNVQGMTSLIFEQCSGFLRIKNGTHPLDATFIHPESYYIISRIADKFKCRIQDLIGNSQKLSRIKYNQFTTESGGRFTMRDIIYELANPGRDPRKELMNLKKLHNLKDDIEY
jgi:protein Tex